MNKKYILKNSKRFYSFLVILIVAVSFVFLATTVNGADSKPSHITVTVKKGDTLWDLAKTYKKSGDIRKYIYNIKTLNGRSDSTLIEGEVIKLPI